MAKVSIIVNHELTNLAQPLGKGILSLLCSFQQLFLVVAHWSKLHSLQGLQWTVFSNANSGWLERKYSDYFQSASTFLESSSLVFPVNCLWTFNGIQWYRHLCFCLEYTNTNIGCPEYLYSEKWFPIPPGEHNMLPAVMEESMDDVHDESHTGLIPSLSVSRSVFVWDI